MTHTPSRRRFLQTGAAVSAAGALAGVLAPLVGGADEAVASAALDSDASSVGALGVAATASSGRVKALRSMFDRPTAQQRCMSRNWFPDAGAGLTTAGLKMVDTHFRQLAAGGFGGAEIAFLSDSTSYTNADAKTIGFGSPAWKNIVRQILRTANAVPSGFTLDFALSSHWPVAVNIIDPNDDGQQQQSETAYAKVTSDDLTATDMALPTPTRGTKDLSGAPFVFVDKLVAASVAKVTAMNAGSPTFELASLTDASPATAKVTVTPAEAAAGTPYHKVDGVMYAGNAAGVPDEAWAAANNIDYSTIVADWGPDPASAHFPGKIDADGNRKRMADWQYLYQTSLSNVSVLAGYTPSEGSTLSVGDYVLIGVYRRGTGQVMSGGNSITQYNRPFVVDVYDSQGVTAIKDFWEQKILDHEIITLMRENSKRNPQNALFEDSFEVQRSTQFWPASLIKFGKRANGYDPTRYAYLWALNSVNSFDDTAAGTRLLEDYVLALSYGYEHEHIAGIEAWGATFGFGFKNQSEGGLPGVAGAEPGLSVVEGDNASGDEGFRNMAGAVNLAGTKLLSNEALTFVVNNQSTTFRTMEIALNEYWATGVNRVNVHGTPFPKTFNGYQSTWPGWEFAGFGAIEHRQIWWTDIAKFSSFIGRSQAIMQGGSAKVDVAVLEGTNGRFGLASNTNLPLALNRGYSYNVVDEKMVQLPDAVVDNGVLAPSGPAYRAIVVSGATRLSVAAVRTLIQFAKARLPIIQYNCDISRVFGTERSGNTDAALATELAALQKFAVVEVASTEEQVLSLLAAHSVLPLASYSAANMLSACRETSTARFYFLYSEGVALTAASSVGDTTLSVSSAEGLAPGQELTIDSGALAETVTIASISGTTLTLTSGLTKSHDGPASFSVPANGSTGPYASSAVDTAVTLAGYGVPYLLDQWTGEVVGSPEFTTGNGTVTLPITLRAGDAVVVALAPKSSSAALPTHVTSVSGGEAVTVDGALALRAFAAGTYTVTVSSNRRRTIAVDSVPILPALSQWNLELQSWGPDAGADKTNPTVSEKTTVQFNKIALGTWRELTPTASQLSKLGVSSMDSVSGIGTYTAKFALPTGKFGALLRLGHHVDNDIIVEVTVNGTKLDPLDQFLDESDLGPYLRHGRTNTVTVRIDTTLNNRVGEKFTWGWRGIQDYGLTSAVLVPYVDTML